MRIPLSVIVLLVCLGPACSKSGTTPAPVMAEGAPPIPAYAAASMSGCDHDAKSKAIAPHAWPYPAEARNIRWDGQYERVRLKLSPNPATFHTATVSWDEGELVEVLDSEVWIKKPRKVVTNEDIWVTRKVWDQGLQVEKPFQVAAKGETVDFLFYNSRGICMVQTKAGPAWTRCTLGETFEGVTADEPFACEQVWWVEVKKSRVDKGWMPFDESFMARLPAPPSVDVAK